MKRKIGTVLDEELLWKAKKTAVEKKESFSQLLEEALTYYLSIHNEQRQAGAVERTRGILKIKAKTLKKIMAEEGFYES